MKGVGGGESWISLRESVGSTPYSKSVHGGQVLYRKGRELRTRRKKEEASSSPTRSSIEIDAAQVSAMLRTPGVTSYLSIHWRC